LGWVGTPPEGVVARQMDVYRSYAKQSHQADFAGDDAADGFSFDQVRHFGKISRA
jgi:hypothetical protein